MRKGAVSDKRGTDTAPCFFMRCLTEKEDAYVHGSNFAASDFCLDSALLRFVEGGGYHVEQEAKNIGAQIFFCPAAETAPEPGPWDRLYGQSFEADGVQIYMSALTASKEETAGVQAFNGIYFGTLWMRKGDTELSNLYWIQQGAANRLIFSYTCVPSKGEAPLSPAVS